MSDSIQHKVSKIVAEQLGLEIPLSFDFFEDLGADGLDLIEIVMAVEEEFSIELPDGFEEKMKTLGELSKQVSSLVEKPTPEVSPLGVKYDQGKLRWTLLPWRSLRGVVEILEMGAKKYSEDNWKHVEPQRYKDAALRHFTDWLAGEKFDQESGKSHLYHCICCLLFLAWFEEAGEI